MQPQGRRPGSSLSLSPTCPTSCPQSRCTELSRQATGIPCFPSRARCCSQPSSRTLGRWLLSSGNLHTKIFRASLWPFSRGGASGSALSEKMDKKTWGVLLLAAAAIVRHHPPTTTHESGGRRNEPSLTKENCSPPSFEKSIHLLPSAPLWSCVRGGLHVVTDLSKQNPWRLPWQSAGPSSASLAPLCTTKHQQLNHSLSLTPNGSLAHSLTDENICYTHPRHRDAARGVGRSRGGMRWVTRLNHGEAGDLQVLPRPWCVQSPSRPMFVCQPHLAPSL